MFVRVTLSRIKQSNGNCGKVIDAIGGYAFIAIFWLAISFYRHNSESTLIELCSLLILIINLWCRLYLNKKNASGLIIEQGQKIKQPRKSTLYYCYENMEFGSAQVPLFVIFLYIDKISIFVIIYFILALFLFLWTIRDIYLITRLSSLGK